MKRFVSSLVTAALVFSVTASAFALEDPVQNEIYNKPVTQIIHPKYVESLVERKEVEEIRAAYKEDIAKLEEEHKALHEE